MNRNLLKLKPYKQGIQPKNSDYNLKLNTNENLYHPKISVIKEIIKEIKFFGNKLKFYPDPDSVLIKNSIAEYYNIDTDNVFIGNGSDDILANVFLTFFKCKSILYLIDLTYSFYESYIKLYKIGYKLIKLNKNFSINIEKFKKNNNIVLNNPNAPVGKILSFLKISLLISKLKKNFLLIDETYIDFENKTNVKLIKKKKNIILVKTFSKFKSLAGLRIGFSLAEKKLINKMILTKNCLNSYPLNIISQIAVRRILKNNKYLKNIKGRILKNKLFLKNELKNIGFKVFNSKTNFIIANNNNININKLVKHLSEKKIFIRKFEIPKIENFIRITVGRYKDCLILIKHLNNFIKL